VTDQRTEASSGRRRRADAERNVALILDATVDCLTRDPDASMAEIARQAGVVRATIYAHFANRDALIDAVTDDAIGHVASAIAAAEPDRGDPVEALHRVVRATWRTVGRYHALIAINSTLPQDELHQRHNAALSALEPLLIRGQKSKVFRRDTSVAWHQVTIRALVHAASAEVSSGRVSESEIEPALLASVLGAVCGSAAR
jgi:TetR/AcrR family transcriptional regulator, mexCD-oprJ operon repressor